MTSLAVSTTSTDQEPGGGSSPSSSSDQHEPAVVSPAMSLMTTQAEEEEEEQEEEEEPSVRLGHLSTRNCRYAKVVGIRYYRGVAHPGEYVRLEREPHNPYDRNAVRVDNLRGEKVGHIKRELAVYLARLMDDRNDNTHSLEGLTIDASIPTSGNAFELPVELNFYGPARLGDVIERTLERIVYGGRAGLHPTTPGAAASRALANAASAAAAAALPPSVVVQARQVDWKQAQKQLDDMFTKQVEGQLKDLPNIPTPPALTSTLLDHQSLGMRWMVQQETPAQGDDAAVPFYQKTKEQGKNVWLCEITQASQPNKPEPVRGGILADDMGLGKTLQTIALTLAHPPPGRDYTKPLVDPNAAAAAEASTTTASSTEEQEEKPPSFSRPTKTAVQKVKLTPLQAVLRAANLPIPMGSKKADLVKAVMAGLDSGALTPQVYQQTLLQQQEQEQAKAAAAFNSSATPSGPITTLIVCPVSVMSNWQTQINAHVAPHTLRVALYHGSDRKELISQLDQIDVLIASYGTLQTDHHRPQGQGQGSSANINNDTTTSMLIVEPAAKRPKNSAGESSSIFEAHFHRIVLDEAHTVRNAKSRTFQACQALRATHRWCLTGTPLQNKPDDIQSLWQFLRVPPLGDAQVFRRAISQPIKEGQDEGLSRLRAMMAHVALRRNKDMVTIQMVSKDVQIRSVVASPDSRHQQIHDTLFRSAKSAFKVALQDGDERALQQTASVFEVLTRLRQACCSGSLVPKERLERAEEVLAAIESSGTQGGQLSAAEGLKLLEKLKGVLEHAEGEDAQDCAVCFDPLTETAAVALRVCGHVFCQGCIGKVAQTSGQCPFCRQSFAKDDMIAWSAASQAATITPPDSDDEKATSLLSQQMDQLGPSPKMEAMLVALKEIKPDEKVVCFSQFTKFLDEIQPFLASHGFSFTRIDGKKTAAQRLEALTCFSKEDGPTIMLCSLHAAGTGINLTRANHVFMMDTWFNLSVEQQAMDRVHRIGQTRPVRILRFVTADSVESRMLSLQEAKAALGKGAFENLSADEKKKARLGDVKKLLQLCDE